MKRLALVCVLVGRAYADVSAGADHKPFDWSAACFAGLQRATDEIKTRFGVEPQPPVDFTTMAPTRVPSDCERDAEFLVVIHSHFDKPAPAWYQVTFRTNGPEDQSTAGWKASEDDSGRSWHRRQPGSVAVVVVKPRDAPAEIATIFKRALDVCVTSVPARVAPAVPPSTAEVAGRCTGSTTPALCQDAETAAWELEHSCVVESAAVGQNGRGGGTPRRLARITALDSDATPILVRLARSKNPTARAVAANGLARVHSSAGRAVLRSLATDREETDVQGGCLRSHESVASFAKDALATYR